MANILVIDDDIEIRDLLEFMLSEDNHQITMANDGEEGLAAFRHGKFDLVITDIIMPNKDGIHLIINLQNLSSVPIIAMSGGRRIISSDFTLDSASELGMKITLKKPFNATELRQAIKQALPND